MVVTQSLVRGRDREVSNARPRTATRTEHRPHQSQRRPFKDLQSPAPHVAGLFFRTLRLRTRAPHPAHLPNPARSDARCRRVDGRAFTLAEGRASRAKVQADLVAHQTPACLADRAACPRCGASRAHKAGRKHRHAYSARQIRTPQPKVVGMPARCRTQRASAGIDSLQQPLPQEIHHGRTRSFHRDD